MIPAASLSNDSPSRIDIDPLGNILPLVIAETATASVGQRIAELQRQPHW